MARRFFSCRPGFLPCSHLPEASPHAGFALSTAPQVAGCHARLATRGDRQPDKGPAPIKIPQSLRPHTSEEELNAACLASLPVIRQGHTAHLVSRGRACRPAGLIRRVGTSLHPLLLLCLTYSSLSAPPCLDFLWSIASQAGRPTLAVVDSSSFFRSILVLSPPPSRLQCCLQPSPTHETHLILQFALSSLSFESSFTTGLDLNRLRGNDHGRLI